MQSSPRFAVIVAALPFLLALGAAVASPQARARSGVAITFLANEGVLLSADGPAGPRKVLIDGLFLSYGRDYAVPADSTQAALERARPPFDGVGLVLVTHRHGDHFHPAPVAAHLQANPRAALLTSRQVIDSLRAGAGARVVAPLASRLVARTTPPGRRQRMVIDGIPVELVGLPHVHRRNRHVEHLGFIVELGGRRVLHVGDAELTEATLAPLRLDTMRIDVALLPHWTLTDTGTRRAILRWIRPRHVAAIHLPAGDAERPRREVQTAARGVHLFTRSLETRRW